MKYLYQVAEEKDERELRNFVASMPMPGSISIRFERNPDFFEAAKVEGELSETLIVRSEEDRITGIGCRSEKRAFINGKELSLGYLSGLRVDLRHRSFKYLSQAYKELKGLHEKGSSKIYLTTIVDDNIRAQKVLESGRSSLPKYNYFGQYLTYVVPSYKFHGNAGFEIKLASKQDLPTLVDFLNKEGRRKQFFPKYKIEDFEDGLLKGLNKIYLAFKDGEVCGCMGLWDQHRYKQIFIDSYSLPMKFIRPLYNIQAFLRRKPGLPGEGKELNSLKVAVPVAQNDSPEILCTLLARISKEAQKIKRPLLYGLHEKDAFKTFLESMKERVYKSKLYAVHWPDGAEAFSKLDKNSVPYLELGGL